jgi:hypothetical protein
LIDLFVDLVCFLVILLICRSRKQAILVIGVLKLLWVDLGGILASSGLRFPMYRFNASNARR